MAQVSRQPTREDETVPQGGDTVGYVQSEVCWNLRPDQEGWDDWTTFNTEDVESAYKTDHERGGTDPIFEHAIPRSLLWGASLFGKVASPAGREERAESGARRGRRASGEGGVH